MAQALYLHFSHSKHCYVNMLVDPFLVSKRWSRNLSVNHFSLLPTGSYKLPQDGFLLIVPKLESDILVLLSGFRHIIAN